MKTTSVLKKMKVGESRIVAIPMEYRDPDTDWAVQTGEKLQVTNIRGEKADFYVRQISGYPEMLLIGKETLELYPTKRPEEKEELIASFEQRGEIYAALEPVFAAIEQNEFKKGSLRLKPGEMPIVADAHGKNPTKLKVWKIVSGIVMITDPSSRGNELGLLDRLHMAWQIFNGKFFSK